jgi:hypothetical protein
MSKYSPITKRRRRSKTLPALGFAGVSLSMASGACAPTGEAMANTPPTSQSQSQKLLLSEEEISDVSLATFYVFDNETGQLAQRLRLARGGCGGGGCGGHGCGGGGGCHAGGGCHMGGCGGGCHMGGCHMGGCHFGGCHGHFFFRACVGCAGCGGCGGCGGTCWIWTPGGWIYSCGAESLPASRVAKQMEQTAEVTKTVDRRGSHTRVK